MSASVDVLLFEDRADQVTRIAEWLGLIPSQYTFCPKFAQVTPTGRHPNDEAEQGWHWIESEIRRVNPKVVVLDYLLAKHLGNLSYDGLDYGKRCKELWVELGVVLVTTGGDDDLAGHICRQTDLDKQRTGNQWPIDAAWIKPWGTAQATASDTKVQVGLQKLLRSSRSPSEHNPAS